MKDRVRKKSLEKNERTKQKQVLTSKQAPNIKLFPFQTNKMQEDIPDKIILHLLIICKSMLI
jgi:hypothetical protein